jgi:hypothetical protein
MSEFGTTRTSRDVRFGAAIRDIADIKRADPSCLEFMSTRHRLGSELINYFDLTIRS